MDNETGMTLGEMLNCMFAIVLMVWFYGAIPLGLTFDLRLMYMMIGAYAIYVIHACC